MTTITKKITTEIEVDGIEDVINVVLNRENVTPEAVLAIQARLKKIVLPWTKDTSHPPRFVRRLGDGTEVGRVDSWLGGYGSPHAPHKHGWGYKGTNPRGQGACTGGIVKVDTGDLVTTGEITKKDLDAIRACETSARNDAMDVVDAFLAKEFPDLILLQGGER